MNFALWLSDSEATAQLGRRLAELLPRDYAGWLILLQGELGSGKSTLARAILHTLGHEGPVPSPTYTLVEPYDIEGRRTVHHVDLYRIGDASELEFLGWTELGEGLVLTEWPERVPALLEQADLLVRLGFPGSGAAAGRDVLISAGSDRGAALLRSLSGKAGPGVNG